MRQLRRIGLLVGVLATLAAQAVLAQPALQKATIAWGGDGMQNMIADIAIRAGYFKDEGIALDIINVNSGTLQAAALLGGTADFAAMGMTTVLNVREKGGDVVAVGTVYDVISMNLVLSKKAFAKAGITDGMSTDEKVKRLKGMRIGVNAPGSGADVLLRSVLLARGMNPDTSMQIQTLGTGPTLLAAMEQGSTDGFVWMAPTVEMALSNGTGQVVLDPFKGQIPEVSGVPYIVFATSKKAMAEKPQVIKGALRALTRAMKLVQEKPQEAKTYVRAVFPELDPAIFEAVYATAVKGCPTTPVLTSAQVDKTIAWFNTTRKTPYKLGFPDVAATQLAQVASKEVLGR
jgi:NitT/TauT family transport system substrate-binding protein